MKRLSIISDHFPLNHPIKLKETERYLFFRLLSGIFLWLVFLGETKAQNPDVPYVPTSEPVVQKMLDIANVGPGDYLIDLGSGDGRVVIEAAKRGAFGQGVEINPRLVADANENAIRKGVQDKVIFVEGNIFDTDISRADVVTMYLFNSVNMILRPQLLKMLKPGSRVVSHRFNMNAWKPDKQIKGDAYNVYLWIIPANLEGNWTWKLKEKKFTMDVVQQFQEISLNIFLNDVPLKVENCYLTGNKIWFAAIDTINAIKYVHCGSIGGDSIKGTVQLHIENNNSVMNWTATCSKVKLNTDKQLLLSR